MIVCNNHKLDGKRCNGAPDFVIEIVSPSNPADDYIKKHTIIRISMSENIGLLIQGEKL